MDSLQLLTLYLALTPIFSGRKTKIILHMTPELTVVLPISCLLPCADQGIFLRGGGGGGVHVNLTKKALTALFVCLFLCFAFFLVLGLFYRSQMVSFKEKYHFSRFRTGSKFSRGVQLFSGGGGSNCFFPIETQITCDFPGGGPDSLPPSGSALGCDLLSFPVRKMMRSPLAPVLVFLQLRCMFSVEPRNKIVS